MRLRGKVPVHKETRLKMLVYGGAGVGKTTFALNFPSPYIIDSEEGCKNPQYIELIEKGGGLVFNTSDFDEVFKELRFLLVDDHDYKTLVIDSMTKVYDDLLEKCEINVGSDFGRHYAEANKIMKRFLNFILRLDMNVIITAHSKTEYGKNLSVLGQTYDCYKKLDYLFDLVFEVKKIGRMRKAYVKKTRIRTFDDFEEFDFSYDNVSERYGADIIERDFIKEVVGTREQIDEFNRLIALFKISDSTVSKWCLKAKCDLIEDMNQEFISKCIDSLQVRENVQKAKED